MVFALDAPPIRRQRAVPAHRIVFPNPTVLLCNRGGGIKWSGSGSGSGSGWARALAMGWMEGWMEGWMDGWVICGCFVVCLFVVLYPASLLVVFTKLFVR